MNFEKIRLDKRKPQITVNTIKMSVNTIFGNHDDRRYKKNNARGQPKTIKYKKASQASYSGFFFRLVYCFAMN